MTAVADCIGQRVLVAVDAGQPEMVCVRTLSPRGQYVWLTADSTGTDGIWRHVSFVDVLEVLGEATETADALSVRLAPESTVQLDPVPITATVATT